MKREEYGHRYTATLFETNGEIKTYDFKRKKKLIEFLKETDEEAYIDYMDRETCYGKRGTWKIESIY